jgi:hypothetical protein
MFAGMLFFALIVMFVPEGDLGTVVEVSPDADATPATSAAVDGHSHSHGHGGKPTPGKPVSSRRLMTTGIIAAIGISLHNLPEGLVVYNATIGGVCNESAIDWAAPLSVICSQLIAGCLSRGIVVTWAIALHNIPGVCLCSVGCRVPTIPLPDAPVAGNNCPCCRGHGGCVANLFSHWKVCARSWWCLVIAPQVWTTPSFLTSCMFPAFSF